MGRLAFVAWVLATAACLDPASAAEYIAPPYLTRLFPDKGHVVGGTSVTIFGGGFVRSPHASVRFAHASGEVDVVPAAAHLAEDAALARAAVRTPCWQHALAVADNGFL